jgi:glycosyltransferase involved in cell wall biosynthesis
MNDPQISIVLPVYNAGVHLASLLSSLMNQSERSLEIVAVDDGSTDNSLSILEEAAKTDARVVVFSQSNRGVSAARNYALKHVRGRWIAFADSDDWLDPNTLETWRRHAENAQLDVLIGNGFHFSDKPEEIISPPPLFQRQPWQEVVGGADWIVRSVATEEWPHYVWLQLVSRDLLERSNADFVEGIVHEDILWTLHLALAAQRIGFLSRPLYGYRINPESQTRSPSTGAIHKRAQSYLVVMQHLIAAANESQHNPRLRRALFRHANREGGHFLGLMRNRVPDPIVRRELAQRFFRLGLSRAMFQGAANQHGFWRALRCWLVLRQCAAKAI